MYDYSRTASEEQSFGIFQNVRDVVSSYLSSVHKMDLGREYPKVTTESDYKFRVEGQIPSTGQTFSMVGEMRLQGAGLGLALKVAFSDFQVSEHEMPEVPPEVLALEAADFGPEFEGSEFLKSFRRRMVEWRAGQTSLTQLKATLKQIAGRVPPARGPSGNPLAKTVNKAIKAIHELPGGKS